ncbi:hypothetical protein OQ292_22725 (plasmid) [Chondrinema litorale]|nr:SRPBCC domain-containing protein [Chondrinema litorale]UZR96475.1 hypothetical protein OQ292_22725 [Chondrinema litorale]
MGWSHCEIIDLKPNEYIAYTYCGEATGEKTLACAGIYSDTKDNLYKGIFTQLDTVLSFTLEPTCAGTILRLKHAGYKGLKLVIVSFVMQMGWKKQLQKKLPNALAEMTKR